MNNYRLEFEYDPNYVQFPINPAMIEALKEYDEALKDPEHPDHFWIDKEGPLEISWQYEDETGTFVEQFPWHYSVNIRTQEVTCFWWEDGNGACDCNRSRHFGLADKYPERCTSSDSFPCGDTIKITNIKEYKER